MNVINKLIIKINKNYKLYEFLYKKESVSSVTSLCKFIGYFYY